MNVGLKNCPFCGEHDLRLTGPYNHNNDREYHLLLTCDICDAAIRYSVGYQQYINLGGGAADFMFVELRKKWNTRNSYAIRIDLTGETGEVTPSSPGSSPPTTA